MPRRASPQALAEVVDRAVCEDPAQRYQDAGALLAIAGILTGGLLDFMALRKTQMT